MPEFLLNRTYTLRSTMGHIINFKKGEPVYVPPTVAHEAVAIGAECVDGAVDVLGDGPPAEPVYSPQEREDKLLEVFERLVKRNQRGDFSAQGIPNIKTVSDLAGFAVEKRELEDTWQKRLNTLNGV